MLYAVGVIEIRSIAKGIEACDDALKSANIRLVSAHPSCPGKYEMILTGPLSDVQTSLERVRDTYGRYVIDAVLMGRIDETVVRALLGGQNAKAEGALGVIETFSASSAIKAADTAVKTSKVEMGFIDRFSGTLIFTGRISNVQAAVSSILTYLKNHLGFTICEITRT